MQFVVNLVLIAIVVRLAVGPVRCAPRWGGSSSSAGPAHLGYGVIAFIMVVLWGPAGLGSASVFLILPPLLVAQWAYGQYAEEVKGHERALDVLVAAVEAKAPHLVGHSGRVAELSASMAEQLGLRAQTVADVRVAGMLHDLGLTTLPTGLVRSTGVVGGRGLRGYPVARGPAAAGAELPLRGPRRHRAPPRGGAPPTRRPARAEPAGPHRRPGRRVRPAHRGGHPDGVVVTSDEAVDAAPRRRPPVVTTCSEPWSRRCRAGPGSRVVRSLFPQAHRFRALAGAGAGITVLAAAFYAGGGDAARPS